MLCLQVFCKFIYNTNERYITLAILKVILKVGIYMKAVKTHVSCLEKVDQFEYLEIIDKG